MESQANAEFRKPLREITYLYNGCECGRSVATLLRVEHYGGAYSQCCEIKSIIKKLFRQ